jgi:hypothetical protein
MVVVLEQSLLTVNQLKQDKIIINTIDIDSQIRNHHNRIRRIFVKSVFNQKLINLDDVTNIYDIWRKDDEYIVLRGLEEHKQQDLDGNVNQIIDEYVYRFIKASKRGNDVYRYIIKQKFKELDKIQKIEYFRDTFKRKKTKLLFITLTYDTKASTPVQSWYIIPKLFNKFKSNLTKKFGKIKVFRVWESTKEYYAHIHCLIYFEEYEFEVFEHIAKKGKNKGKLTYRIPYYQSNKIKEYYPYNIDIQACESFNKAIDEITKYVGKYLIKDNEEDKPTKTNAMIWLTNKQGYSVSKDFFKCIIGKNIDVEEPKSADLTSYMCNSNFNVKKWEFVGLISREELGISGNIWLYELKKPPPKAIGLINLLILEKINRFERR